MHLISKEVLRCLFETRYRGAGKMSGCRFRFGEEALENRRLWIIRAHVM